MAILVLKGADFSANNVGQITLPEDMHEFTRKIFLHCKRFSVYSKQAEVINDFICYLDDEGLLEHIGMMIAPWLSSDVNEAVYDLVSDTQFSITGEDYSFNNGLLNMSKNNCCINIDIPLKNFMGCLISTKTNNQFSPAFLGPYYSSPALINQSSSSLGVLSPSLSGSGYKISATDQKCFTANLKGFQDFNSNGSTVDGMTLSVMSGYTKSTEPWTDARLTRLIPQWNQNGKTIIFAGDGTNLTDDQLTSLTNKMIDIQNRLVALEG